MTSSIILIVLILVLVFIFILYKERKYTEAEGERFREFVRAVKSKTLEEYEQTIPIKSKVPEEPKDEFVELDEVDPSVLLNTVKKK